MLACETVVTLYQVSDSSEGGGSKWEIMDYGILAILSKQDELALLIGDVDSGELQHEFALKSASRYRAQKPHFHSFVAGDGKLRGIGFVDVSVAEKVLRVLHQLLVMTKGVISEADDVQVPQAKRAKVGDNYSEWVIINREDVPLIIGNEASGEVEENDGADETDFGFFSKKHESKQNFKVDDISGPSYFRHLTNVTEESVQAASLKGVGPVGGEVKTTTTFERGTKRSSSFIELSGIDLQPAVNSEIQAASSTSEIPSSTSFASSFSGSSLEVPEPPAHESSHDTLLSQISTFDRRMLHHVLPEEVAKTEKRTHTRKYSLTSMFQNGFGNLLPKLQALRLISTVASINSSGEEEGFDDFDGPVFE